MRDEIILGLVGVVCITALGATYMLVFKQDGSVLAVIISGIGAIIGGLAGYSVAKRIP